MLTEEQVVSMTDNELSMACKMCSWDTFCVKPPTYTKLDIDTQIKDSAEKDKESETPGIGSLMAALMFGGKDTMGFQCSLFSLKLRQSRVLSDKIKSLMQE